MIFHRSAHARIVARGCFGALGITLVCASTTCSHDWQVVTDGRGDPDGGSQLETDGAVTCGPGETNCNGSCVDLQLDPKHCGTCDRACAAGVPCASGACQCAVAPLEDLGSTVPQTVREIPASNAEGYAGGCAGGKPADRFFRFTASETGTYLFEVIDASYDVRLAALVTDTCQEVACGRAESHALARAVVNLEANQSVILAVSGADGADGFFVLGASRRRTGTCATTEIGSTVPQSVSGNTSSAADSLAPSCVLEELGSADAAFAFVAPEDGTYTFDTRGSEFDTILDVLDGSCSGFSLGCNDDDSAQPGPSFVRVGLSAGQRVVVVVDGFEGSVGAFRLNIDVAPPPMCVGEPLPSMLPVTIRGTTAGRPDQMSGTCSPLGFIAPDIDYTFTADTAGTYVIDTFGSTFDTVLYVREGSCFGEELNCNDDYVEHQSVQSRVKLELDAGQTISVIVDGYNGEQGDFTLNIHQ